MEIIYFINNNFRKPIRYARVIFYSLILLWKDRSLYFKLKNMVSNIHVRDELTTRLGKGAYSNNKLIADDFNDLQKYWDIIFISQKTSPDIIKDMMSIKIINPKINICLITQNTGQVKSLASKFSDSIIVYDNEIMLLTFVKMVKAGKIIIRRGDVYQAFLVTMFYTGRIVYRPYPLIARYPEHVWGMDRNYCEKEIINKCNRIYHLYDENVEVYIKNKYNFTGPMLTVRSEVLPQLDNLNGIIPNKLSESDNNIHVVYAAGIQREGSPSHITGHSNQFEKFKIILDQGIHLHWYQAYPRKNDSSLGLKKYFDLENEYKNFHREDPLEYDKLLVELKKYNFALQHFSFEKVNLKPEFINGGSNGFYTHLQAGNALIVSSSTPIYADIVKKYNIGFVYDTAFDFIKLSEDIKNFEYDGFDTRMKAAQSNCSYPMEDFNKFILN